MMSDKITETPREERIPPLPPPAMCLVATSSWEALYVARGDAAYDSALIDVRGAHSALKDTVAHWQAKHAALLADAERLRGVSEKRLTALKAAALFHEMMRESETCAQPADPRYAPMIGEWNGRDSAGERFAELTGAVGELRTAAIRQATGEEGA